MVIKTGRPRVQSTVSWHRRERRVRPNSNQRDNTD